jgi:Myosin head (motor domain)
MCVLRATATFTCIALAVLIPYRRRRLCATAAAAAAAASATAGPASPKEGGPGKAVGQTVATRFTTSLNDLTEVLNTTQSRFVRCVKTNNLLKPQIFDKPSVLRQLKVMRSQRAARVCLWHGRPVRIHSDTASAQRMSLVSTT